MARKIGDLAVLIVILSFMVAGISYLFGEFDQSVGLTDTYVNASLTEISATTDDVNDVTSDFDSSTSSISEVETSGNYLEIRGSGSASVLGIGSKNVVISFFNQLYDKFPVLSSLIIGFLVSLFLVFCTIVLLRFFWGENKI